MEDAYLFDFWLEYATGMTLRDKTADSYYPNEVRIVIL